MANIKVITYKEATGKLKDIYEEMEEFINSVDRIGKLIRGILVKHS